MTKLGILVLTQREKVFRKVFKETMFNYVKRSFSIQYKETYVSMWLKKNI